MSYIYYHLLSEKEKRVVCIHCEWLPDMHCADGKACPTYRKGEERCRFIHNEWSSVFNYKPSESPWGDFFSHRQYYTTLSEEEKTILCINCDDTPGNHLGGTGACPNKSGHGYGLTWYMPSTNWKKDNG